MNKVNWKEIWSEVWAEVAQWEWSSDGDWEQVHFIDDEKEVIELEVEHRVRTVALGLKE